MPCFLPQLSPVSRGGWLFLLPLLIAGCIEAPTDPALEGVAGEWCTERTIGPGNQPVEELPYVALSLGQEGSRVGGSGAVKRMDSNTLWAVRYDGTTTGERVTLSVEGFTADAPDRPSFTLELRVISNNRLEGTVFGDPGFPGTLPIVRLGNRCFTN